MIKPGRTPRRADGGLSERLRRRMQIWKLCLEVSAEIGSDDPTLRRATRRAEEALGEALSGRRSRWGVWSEALRDAGVAGDRIGDTRSRYVTRLARLTRLTRNSD